MTNEITPKGIQLTDIHINLTERSITFRAEQQLIGKLTLESGGTIFFEPHPGAALLPAGESAKPEKEPTVIVSGRLKAKPREGKPDRSGKPTAYALFAAHEEGNEEPHMYLASFHRHTVQIALLFEPDTPMTLQGYPHHSDDPDRKDTFSVINILQYPGKTQKSQKMPR